MPASLPLADRLALEERCLFRSPEQVWFALGGHDPRASTLKLRLLDLDHDEPPPKPRARDPCGPAPLEGIKNRLSLKQ